MIPDNTTIIKYQKVWIWQKLAIGCSTINLWLIEGTLRSGLATSYWSFGIIVAVAAGSSFTAILRLKRCQSFAKPSTSSIGAPKGLNGTCFSSPQNSGNARSSRRCGRQYQAEGLRRGRMEALQTRKNKRRTWRKLHTATANVKTQQSVAAEMTFNNRNDTSVVPELLTHIDGNWLALSMCLIRIPSV